MQFSPIEIHVVKVAAAMQNPHLVPKYAAKQLNLLREEYAEDKPAVKEDDIRLLLEEMMHE